MGINLPDQKMTGQDDGSIVFEVEVAGTDEIKCWIRTWGAHAEILEPQSLRNKMQTELKAAPGGYINYTDGLKGNNHGQQNPGCF